MRFRSSSRELLSGSFIAIVVASVGALALPACGEGGGEDGGGFQPSGTCSIDRAPVIEEGPTMAPGGPCISCHSNGEGPDYDIAGTVMGASHDGDVCVGVDGVTVVVTDANGQTIEIPTNAVGNFFYRGAVATPFTAKVVGPNGENVMTSPQSDGDCNGCHTEQGANSAPGRIVAP